ncbi:MAG: hypothetical protein KJ601_03170 [Nanoarchaeota archaeon]|nr:hypothetical protein [Nanoarchaeota archaeon]MBU1704389.1 hypothetical protein [Nanoarchaeota archaeon]
MVRIKKSLEGLEVGTPVSPIPSSPIPSSPVPTETKPKCPPHMKSLLFPQNGVTMIGLAFGPNKVVKQDILRERIHEADQLVRDLYNIELYRERMFKYIVKDSDFPPKSGAYAWPSDRENHMFKRKNIFELLKLARWFAGALDRNWPQQEQRVTQMAIRVREYDKEHPGVLNLPKKQKIKSPIRFKSDTMAGLLVRDYEVVDHIDSQRQGEANDKWMRVYLRLGLGLYCIEQLRKRICEITRKIIEEDISTVDIGPDLQRELAAILEKDLRKIIPLSKKQRKLAEKLEKSGEAAASLKWPTKLTKDYLIATHDEIVARMTMIRSIHYPIFAKDYPAVLAFRERYALFEVIYNARQKNQPLPEQYFGYTYKQVEAVVSQIFKSLELIQEQAKKLDQNREKGSSEEPAEIPGAPAAPAPEQPPGRDEKELIKQIHNQATIIRRNLETIKDIKDVQVKKSVLSHARTAQVLIGKIGSAFGAGVKDEKEYGENSQALFQEYLRLRKVMAERTVEEFNLLKERIGDDKIQELAAQKEYATIFNQIGYEPKRLSFENWVRNFNIILGLIPQKTSKKKR